MEPNGGARHVTLGPWSLRASPFRADQRQRRDRLDSTASVDELPARLSTLPKRRRIVTYCRGDHCLFDDEAVALLHSEGFNAVRLDGGWPEWLGEGRAIAEPS